jgi:hypothetical protein
MTTITVDISECLYYLIPIIVIWIICYRLFLNDPTHCNRLNHEDRIVLFILSLIMTICISTIYFMVLYMKLNNNFIIQL